MYDNHNSKAKHCILTSSSFIDAVKEYSIIVYCSTDVAIANGWHVSSVNMRTSQW